MKKHPSMNIQSYKDSHSVSLNSPNSENSTVDDETIVEDIKLEIIDEASDSESDISLKKHEFADVEGTGTSYPLAFSYPAASVLRPSNADGAVLKDVKLEINDENCEYRIADNSVALSRTNGNSVALSRTNGNAVANDVKGAAATVVAVVDRGNEGKVGRYHKLKRPRVEDAIGSSFQDAAEKFAKYMETKERLLSALPQDNEDIAFGRSLGYTLMKITNKKVKAAIKVQLLKHVSEALQ